MVYPEAAREPHRETDGQDGRAPALQPQDRTGLPSSRRFPALLDVHEALDSEEIPSRVAWASHAFADRAHEEDRPVVAGSRDVDPQLVPSSRHHLVRCCGGIQQQGQTDYEKILRLP